MWVGGWGGGGAVYVCSMYIAICVCLSLCACAGATAADVLLPPPPGEGADVSQDLLDAMVAHKVVVVPGRLFWADRAAVASAAPCPYFRLAFCTTDDLPEAFRRLAEALRAVTT